MNYKHGIEPRLFYFFYNRKLNRSCSIFCSSLFLPRRISDLSGDAVLSAFFEAVKNNDTEWVEPALEDKDDASPVHDEDHRRTALVLAIKNRHIGKGWCPTQTRNC